MEKSFFLARIVRRAIARAGRKLEKQKEELAAAREWQNLYQIGDTLNAHFHLLKKGLDKVSLANVHTHTMISIPLDPQFSPKENVDLYYRKAGKAKRGQAIIQEQISRTQKESAWLKEILQEIHPLLKQGQDVGKKCGDADQEIEGKLMDIESRLQAKGYLPKSSAQKQEKSEEDEFRCVVLEGKWKVLIGKNDAQNDHLTLHVARPHDLWFHAYGSPGSHVVLRRDSKTEPVPKEIIERTAALAAWFSKQKHASRVPVNYTEKRFVRKPRKSPPGLVVLEREKTLFMKPWNPHEKTKGEN